MNTLITKDNVIQVIEKNKELLNQVLSRVEVTKEINLAFRFQPIEAIKNYLTKSANLIMFPSEDKNYGGLVTYKNGRYFIHINTGQPKTYENFIWAHEFYHFQFEKEEIKSSTIHTFADGSTPNENERMANLFAAELLIDSRILRAVYNEICSLHANDTLENNVIRLIPAFKLPYKSIVIKLAQDGFISNEDAKRIIDYDYRKNLPSDFDLSLLTPSMSIKLNEIGNLLNDEVVKATIRESEYESISKLYNEHLTHLERLRDKEKE